jgi:hypothetical protein
MRHADVSTRQHTSAYGSARQQEADKRFADRLIRAGIR